MNFYTDLKSIGPPKGRAILQLLVPLATTLALILICDVMMLVFMVLLAMRSGGEVPRLGLKVGFFANVVLIICFVGLAVRAIYFFGQFGLYGGALVCFCLSVVETGVAGFLVLSTPWRFVPPALVVFGSLALWHFYIVLRSKLR